MSTATVVLDCPHCETVFDMALPSQDSAASSESDLRLTGQTTNYQQCDHEFEVLFY